MARSIIKLTNVKDAVVRSGSNRDVNFGADSNIEITWYEVQSTRDRVFIGVGSLPAIPSTRSVLRITMNITFRSESSRGVNFFIAKCHSGWNDRTVTYANMPKFSFPVLAATLSPSVTPNYSTQRIELINILSIDELIDGFELSISSVDKIPGTHIDILSSESNDRPLFFEVELADAPRIPSPIQPLTGETINEMSVSSIRFQWQHNPSNVSNLPQKGYFLQLSTDSLLWTNHQATTPNQYADIPVSSVPTGSFFWRVQTIDTDDVPSDWSNIQMVRAGIAPPAPNIIESIFDSSRPTITWTTAFQQSAYQVQILRGQSVLIDAYAETTAQYFQVQTPLENNTPYTVRVRARNEAALFSDWAEEIISTSFGVPIAPQFIAQKKNNGVELMIFNPPGDEPVLRNDVFRRQDDEWIKIGEAEESGLYFDWSVANGRAEYYVSAVGASGDTDSETQAIEVSITNGVLTCADAPELLMPLTWNVSDDHDSENGAVLVEYAGRAKPVAEYDEHIRRSMRISCNILDFALFEELQRMLDAKSIMLYRNKRTKMYGIITNPSWTRSDQVGKIYGFQLTISETEHDEGIS